MKGSIQIKGTKYYMVIPYKNNGKWNYKWISTGLDVKGNNKRKAEQMLQKTVAEMELSSHILPSNYMFCDYILHWLDTTKISVSEVTYRGYKWMCETHIIPYFEQKKYTLETINKNHLQEYFNYKYENGRLDGKGGLSPKTLREYKVILQLVFKSALENNLIKQNPCEFVKLPQIQQREPTYYTKSQIDTMFKAFQNSDLYPLIYVTLTLGLRRSELLGIKWDSIDFEKRTLTIKHTVVKYKGVIEKDTTKNKASHRIYPLNDKLYDIFVSLRDEEHANRKLFGKNYIDNDYVFKWKDGKPYSPDYITAKFSKMLKQNNLPHIRFHDLRHTCASLLLDENYSYKDIQEWLGHATFQTTLNIYAHYNHERKKTISNDMANLI